MNTKLLKIKTGDRIQFASQRIFFGNPVKGKVISKNKEDIKILLEHDIEGLNTRWYAGELKSFPRSYMSKIKII